VYSGVTSGQVADAAAKVWEQKTGGKVVVNKIPFADRAVKYAGVIASQDPSVDVIYAYSGYVGQFGDRLYDDLTHLAGDTSDFVPATLKVLSSKGKLLALPIHSEMEIYIYNKAMFRDAGMDPENPPTTWEELYKSASKLNVGSRYGCVVPWIESTLTFYGVFLNSTPTRLLTDDRNQIAFNNADGLSAFTAINEGFQAKFFDPAAFFLTSDYDSGLLFNQGKAASQINFSELWGQATSGNVQDFKATIKAADVGATIMPGIKKGTSGSTNGFEGFGVSKFSRQKDAALSFVKEMASAAVQKPFNLSRTLPSARISVLKDPAVVAAFPVGTVLAKQGQYNLDRYSAPYDLGPVFDNYITKMFKGEITADQAFRSCVKDATDVIVKYLSK